jgi:hypothetical protein
LKQAINAVPKYIPDPLDVKIQNQRAEAKEAREKLGKAFVPPSGLKSRPIASISPMDPTGPPPVSLRDTLL